MKSILGNCAALVLAVTLVAACNRALDTPTAVATPLPAQPAENFAFSLRFGSCMTDILDMFEHTYTKQIDVEEQMTIPATLTDDQMAAIYREMVAIGFFSYPETFRIAVEEGETYGIVTPAPSYHIRVRNGELDKTVMWTDEIVEPTSPEADRLRGLIQLILQMVDSHPDIQQMPERKVGCI